MKLSSKLISFEGLDGSGKSTQAQKVNDWLSGLGVDVITTSDLAGTWLSYKIREILLQSSDTEVDEIAELLLLSAARKQTFSQIILPALESGKTVLLDRYIDSTLAYQRYGLKIPSMIVDSMINYTVGTLTPDFLIYLDLPAELVEKRTEPDKFTQRGFQYYQRVYLGYEKVLKTRYNDSNHIRVDAKLPEEDIFEKIKSFLMH